MIERINAKGKSVLIISDTHCPYNHPDLFPFLKAIKKKLLNKDSIIIHIGDEVDNHAISFHDSDQDLPSAGHELQLAIDQLAELRSIFDKMYILESNHGSLAYRKAKHHGVPIRVIKPLQDLYDTPNWTWHHDLILDTKADLPTYLCHGKASTYNALAKEMGMNAIQGHFHSKFEITYGKTPTVDRYNMFIGCLIDWKSLAFAYGRNNIPKPILGLGYIDKEGTPSLIKMNLDKKGRWNGKVKKI